MTIGVAFILFMLATASVRGFAFMLGIGTLVSLFTVLATSAILGAMSRTKILRSKWALNPGKSEHSWRFDYSGKSNYFFSVSGVILLICAIAISTSGINFGIDFESGTRIKTPLERPANTIRSATRSTRSDSATPRSRRSTTRRSARTSSRSRPRRCSRTRSTASRSSSTRTSG